MHELHIRSMNEEDRAEWQRLRLALWPDLSPQELQAEMAEINTDPMLPVFVIARPEGGLGGFIETALKPWATGCLTHPVGYIEAWYVGPDLRQQGWGGRLVQAAEAWAVKSRVVRKWLQIVSSIISSAIRHTSPWVMKKPKGLSSFANPSVLKVFSRFRSVPDYRI
jgi:GNAT superfamily N-acetyltransferase